MIYGIHAVMALLKQQADRVQAIYVQEKRQDKRMAELLQLAKDNNVAIEYLSKDELSQKLNTDKHQGVAAKATETNNYSEVDIPSLLDAVEGPVFVLILDGVEDPHNLGACLRSADAAGVTMVIAPKDRAVGITPVVRKVACGAAESVPFIQVTNLARTMRLLKDQGVWLHGAAGEVDKSLYECDLNGSVGLVLGAEGKGLRHKTREECDVLMSIPMFGSVSSLNVSVATGVCLFEVVRQRG